MFVTLCSGEGLYTSGVMGHRMTEHTPIFSHSDDSTLSPIVERSVMHYYRR